MIGLFIAIPLAFGPVTMADDAVHAWPGWRGDGSGHSTERDVPQRWDAQNGITWKTRLTGEGNSSPIVWGDRVFVTASAEGGLTRLVICLNASTGKILWQTPLKADATKTYPRAGHAAATPVTDGRHVFVFFDSPGVAAIDYDGKVAWTVPLGPFNNPYNMASSPILDGDSLIVKCDHNGPSFIVALDKTNGDEQWRTERSGGLHYATPISFEHDGGRQIVVNALKIVSYDAASGNELWTYEEMKHATTPTPVYTDGLVYATCGRNGPSVAIDPTGRGDLSETHVRLYVASGGPYIPSPLVHKGLFVIPGDDGRMTFVDRSGKRVLRHRTRARFTGSPVAAGDRIYWTDEQSRTHVLDTSQLTASPSRIADVTVNPLEEEACYASTAISGSRIFIRTAKHLYCIAGGEAKLAVPEPPDLPDDLNELREFYLAQPVGEFDDTMLRLRIVEKAAHLDDPAVVDLLAAIVDRDGHWDVSEAALRELGRHGHRAVPQLLAMFDKHPAFFKTVAAEHLGRIKSPKAVATLTRAAKAEGVQVRVASVEALGGIAAEHADHASGIADTMVGLLSDTDGMVRLAAIQSLVRLAPHADDRADRIVEGLKQRVDDPNAMVAEAASRAVDTFSRVHATSRADPLPSTVVTGAA